MAEKTVAKRKKSVKGVKEAKREKNYVYTTGKRKKAVARAKVEPGSGKLLINSKPFDIWGTELMRMWIKEPVMIADELAKTVDIDVNVSGGGVTAQSEAIRTAIARGLVSFSKDKKLKNKFLEYNRNLLVYDFRQTEPHKPSRSKKGARIHKQRSKR
jgi:small subunit ribosomal protein S9